MEDRFWPLQRALDWGYVLYNLSFHGVARQRLNQMIFGLLTKLVRSRWLDIGQVLFLRVYGPRRSRGPLTRKKRTRLISSHLDRTSLVNKGFII